MNEDIYEDLKKVARAGDITYYGVIAPLADLDMSLERDRVEIGELLGEISTYEHGHNRPLLSAICVHRVDSKPGTGFFSLARQLELMFPGDDEDVFWDTEIKKVYKYWQTH